MCFARNRDPVRGSELVSYRWARTGFDFNEDARTLSCSTNPVRRDSIWLCSEGGTTVPGVWSFPASSLLGKKNLLITAIHIGTVLDRASGILLPLRVESTMTHLRVYEHKGSRTGIDYTYPPYSTIVSSSCKFRRRELNFHWPAWPSVLLK